MTQHATLTAYIEDRIEVMRLQEMSAYAYVPPPPFLSDANHVLIVKWFYKIVDHFDFKRELVEIANSYLTRFTHKLSLIHQHQHQQLLQQQAQAESRVASGLTEIDEDLAFDDDDEDVSDDDEDASKGDAHNRILDIRSYRLAALTSLYLAVKLFSHKRLKITMAAALSRGEFTAHDIADTEQRMLQVLEYRMNPPTATEFLNHFLVLLGHSQNSSSNSEPSSSLQEAIAAVSNHLVELSMFRITTASSNNHNNNNASASVFASTTLCAQRPSTIALASLLNALNAHGIRQAYPPSMRAVFLQNLYLVNGTSCKAKELQAVRVELNQLYRENYRDDFGSVSVSDTGAGMQDNMEERSMDEVAAARNVQHRDHDRRRDGYTEITP